MMTVVLLKRAEQSWRVPPLVVAALACAAQQALLGKHGPTKSSMVTGVAVLTGSTWLLCGSAVRFRGQATTVNPIDVGADSLVTAGPNRLTRNPMYLGMTGVLLAHAVARRSVAALIPAALFAVVIDRLQIPKEEAVLRERFGTDFEQYAGTTPRWVGRPGRRW